MSDSNGVDSVIKSLKSQTATWLVGLIITVLTIFSSQITERISFALNRADLRVQQYEELASEISTYIFYADIIVEFIENDWTTKQSLTQLIKSYNSSVIKLRSKEFVYLAWLRRYWKQEEIERFENVMSAVKTFDSKIHSLNDEFEAVNITEERKKVNRERAEEALKVMKPELEKMREQGRVFLLSLN